MRSVVRRTLNVNETRLNTWRIKKSEEPSMLLAKRHLAFLQSPVRMAEPRKDAPNHTTIVQVVDVALLIPMS